jgi:hypothetical protein
MPLSRRHLPPPSHRSDPEIEDLRDGNADAKQRDAKAQQRFRAELDPGDAAPPSCRK